MTRRMSRRRVDSEFKDIITGEFSSEERAAARALVAAEYDAEYGTNNLKQDPQDRSGSGKVSASSPIRLEPATPTQCVADVYRNHPLAAGAIAIAMIGAAAVGAAYLRLNGIDFGPDIGPGGGSMLAGQ